jgi:lipopolysaccharide/colanic/teichoic acid biosynthesis glycosyltransferase
MWRLVDLFLAVLVLFLLLPIFMPIMILLRFTGEGEVFFHQQRVGLGGKPFFIIKFATMLKDSPSMGSGTITVMDDPRILPLGGFLRSTKINELPQLINIIKGDMSFIGPRPQTDECFQAFPAQSQKAIARVRPGLSGIGSIVFRNEDVMIQEADAAHFYGEVIMPYKGLLEEWYVSNQSVVLYPTLFILTAWMVVFRRSNIVWKIFRTLPVPPKVLHEYVEYR